jgi:lactaldehyde dehydrogenase/glycolaldehyde dehydrogenase
VLTGGQRPAGEAYDRGYWYEPTVLTDVEQGDDVIKSVVEFDSV